MLLPRNVRTFWNLCRYFVLQWRTGVVQLAGIEMVWLIGAIVTYGIVVLLIGIAVVVYLLGGEAADLATKPDRSAIRRLPHEPNPFARQHPEGRRSRELAYR